MSQNNWERRDKKKQRAWYKRQLVSNRKALELIIRAKESRENKLYGNAISGEPQ